MIPTPAPSYDPTAVPSEAPTAHPTIVPTLEPTRPPTGTPTAPPTFVPSPTPSLAPTKAEDNPKCGHRSSQVMLALDSSGSISAKDWARFMNFTDKIITELPVGENQMQLGIAEFATNASLVKSLTTNKAELLQARRQEVWREHGVRTFMGKGAKIAREQLTDRNLPRSLVIFTDGLASNRTNAAHELLAAKAAGIKVIMVTIGFLANMVPPNNTWLSVPPIKIHEGFVALEAALKRSEILGVVESSVCSKLDTDEEEDVLTNGDEGKATSAPSLAPSTSQYCRPSKGGCTAQGCGGDLQSAAACENAARSLGVFARFKPGSHVQTESSDDGFPSGCYVYTGSEWPHGVYFNMAGMSDSAMKGVEPICRGAAGR